MKTLLPLLGFVLLASSVVAQDGPIPQELPRQFRQDAVRRGVEQTAPRVPLPQPTRKYDGLIKSFGVANRQPPVTKSSVNAGSTEERIAALEAKVEALQREVETQKATIQQLKELLDQQQKKN
jgi:TolA-binding protein